MSNHLSFACFFVATFVSRDLIEISNFFILLHGKARCYNIDQTKECVKEILSRGIALFP